MAGILHPENPRKSVRDNDGVVQTEGAGNVQICTVHDLRVELPASAEFLRRIFEDPTLNEKIKAAEG
jgi:hypothetical protein